MSLIWHIVRKDFRRLRWPLALWLLLPLGQMVLVTSASQTALNQVSFEGMGTWSMTWIGLTWSVGLILAAWLVMEERGRSTAPGCSRPRCWAQSCCSACCRCW